MFSISLFSIKYRFSLIFVKLEWSHNHSAPALDLPSGWQWRSFAQELPSLLRKGIEGGDPEEFWKHGRDRTGSKTGYPFTRPSCKGSWTREHVSLDFGSTSRPPGGLSTSQRAKRLTCREEQNGIERVRVTDVEHSPSHPYEGGRGSQSAKVLRETWDCA